MEHTKEDIHRYYLKLRPPGLGTHPKDTINIVSFDNKQKIRELNILAWGYVEYNLPLSQNEIENYDLFYDNRYGKPIEMSNSEWDQMDFFDKAYYLVSQEKKDILNYIAQYEGYTFKLPKEINDKVEWVIVHPYTKGNEYKYQLSYFDYKMIPFGDSVANNIKDIADKLYEYGYKNTIFDLIKDDRPPMLVKDFKKIQNSYDKIIFQNKKNDREVALI